jgi:NTP pyrophosphatase (non-canonical NTP hydrolase)
MILSQDYLDFLKRTLRYYGEVSDAVQLLKIQEEVGEAAQAFIGVTGANPRKGVTHTPGDVCHELADVAMSALFAIYKLGFDPNQMLEEQQAKAEGLT